MFPAVLRVPPSLRRRARGERGAAPRRRPVRILVDPDASRRVAPRVRPHRRRLARAGRRPGVLRELRSDLARGAPTRAARCDGRASRPPRAAPATRLPSACALVLALRRRRPPVRAQENRREARGGLRGPPRGRGGRGRGGGARAHIFRDARGRTREGGPIGRALRRFAPDVARDARVRARRKAPPRSSLLALPYVVFCAFCALAHGGDARRAHAPADAPRRPRRGPKARRRRRRRVGRVGELPRRTQSPARRLFVSPPRGERAGVRGVRRVALRPRVRVPAPGTRGERGRGQGGVPPDGACTRATPRGRAGGGGSRAKMIAPRAPRSSRRSSPRSPVCSVACARPRRRKRPGGKAPEREEEECEEEEWTA